MRWKSAEKRGDRLLLRPRTEAGIVGNELSAAKGKPVVLVE